MEIEKLALISGRAREEHQQRSATPRAHPNFSSTANCLFFQMEEVVIGRVRNERLLAHIAGDGATGNRGRSTVGV